MLSPLFHVIHPCLCDDVMMRLASLWMCPLEAICIGTSDLQQSLTLIYLHLIVDVYTSLLVSSSAHGVFHVLRLNHISVRFQLSFVCVNESSPYSITA